MSRPISLARSFTSSGLTLRPPSSANTVISSILTICSYNCNVCLSKNVRCPGGLSSIFASESLIVPEVGLSVMILSAHPIIFLAVSIVRGNILYLIGSGNFVVVPASGSIQYSSPLGTLLYVPSTGSKPERIIAFSGNDALATKY